MLGMGLRIGGRFRIAKGVSLNVSKSGISSSVRMGNVTMNSRRGATVRIAPGVSYSVPTGSSSRKRNSKEGRRTNERNASKVPKGASGSRQVEVPVGSRQGSEAVASAQQARAVTGNRRPVGVVAVVGIVLVLLAGGLGSINEVMQNVATAVFGIPGIVCIIVWIVRARHNRRLRLTYSLVPSAAETPDPVTASAVHAAAERPGPQPYGVSHEGAEALAAAWMLWMGLSGAHVTAYSHDGGIDVAQADWVAQVKNYGPKSVVQRPDVQNIFGVAMAEDKRGMFFTSSSYSPGAVEFADRVGVALFVYDAAAGDLKAVNRTAEVVLRQATGADPAVPVSHDSIEPRLRGDGETEL